MSFVSILIGLLGLLSWVLNHQVSCDQLQPGLNPIMSASDISFQSKFWPHDTPLIRSHWSTNATPIATRRALKSWMGWNNINYIFSFGDSYTSTNFTLFGEQPNLNNPLGNPPFPGATSSDGPNYIDFLTSTYNQSFIKTYNLAYGAATINPFLVPTLFGASVRTFLSQVVKDFVPLYTNNSDVPWQPSDSLFIIFFGINDCIQTYAKKNDSLNNDIIASYEGLINRLYDSGARNFVIHNVPPVDRSPGQLKNSLTKQHQLAGYIGRFNFRIAAMITNLSKHHSDATFFPLDTNFLFTLALNNTARFTETKEYRNTTAFCPRYANGTTSLTSFAPECGIPVNQYFWLNSLHPTYPMHNFLASQIIKLLRF